jgi:hypothetical protein
MRKDEQRDAAREAHSQQPSLEDLAERPAAAEGDDVTGGGRVEYTWKIEAGEKRPKQPGLTSP